MPCAGTLGRHSDTHGLAVVPRQSWPRFRRSMLGKRLGVNHRIYRTHGLRSDPSSITITVAIARPALAARATACVRSSIHFTTGFAFPVLRGVVWVFVHRNVSGHSNTTCSRKNSPSFVSNCVIQLDSRNSLMV